MQKRIFKFVRKVINAEIVTALSHYVTCDCRSKLSILSAGVNQENPTACNIKILKYQIVSIRPK